MILRQFSSTWRITAAHARQHARISKRDAIRLNARLPRGTSDAPNRFRSSRASDSVRAPSPHQPASIAHDVGTDSANAMRAAVDPSLQRIIAARKQPSRLQSNPRQSAPTLK
jgi:hypothetical protein